MSDADASSVLDVIIVGGGPAGLCLAHHLSRRGVRFIVLERREQRSEHSRAVGIHPPSLEVFARLDLADVFVSRGVRVRDALAFGNDGLLGELRFDHVSDEFPFVLTLPQCSTEELLETALFARHPNVVIRGATVTGVSDHGSHCSVTFTGAHGERSVLRSRFVVGADGVRSPTRLAVGIRCFARTYGHAYLMGDFDDTTVFGATAVVHLTSGGVVESFPLPGGVRRWVVRTRKLHRPEQPDVLTRLIRDRTGSFVPVRSCRMLSAFTPELRMAARFWRGRVVLLGDAAHVVSPIGGQGMNLAWLDAAHLARALERVVHGRGEYSQLFAHYEARRRRAAWAGVRIAELNMLLGRAAKRPRPRDALVRALLHGTTAKGLAALYAMRWAT